MPEHVICPACAHDMHEDCCHQGCCDCQLEAEEFYDPGENDTIDESGYA